MSELTQEILKQLLDYDIETGLFSWTNHKDVYFMNRGQSAYKKTSNGYFYISINRKRFAAHRLAFLYVSGRFPPDMVDHLNGVRSDNKWSNLREVSNTENQQNQRQASKNNSHGFMGITWHARDKSWQAQIRVNNTRKFLGYFKTPEEAHNAYLVAKRKLHSTCTI